MKTIFIKQISSKGYTLDLNAKEDWVIAVLDNLLSDHPYEKDSVQGQILLQKITQVIDFNGTIRFTHHPNCARCGIELTIHENIPFHVNLAPLYESSEDKKKHEEDQEDIELTQDDLNFSFFEGDKIQIDTILNDEIALNLPYNYYCKDKTHCKSMIPESPHIATNDDIDPRWAPLKGLKINKK